jgi:hypothetical protein
MISNGLLEFIKGLTMGTNLKPSISNIIVQKMETKWFNANSPLVYKRFINDTFHVSKHELDI